MEALTQGRGDLSLGWRHLELPVRRIRERMASRPSSNSGECAAAPDQSLRTLQARRRADYRADVCDFIFFELFHNLVARLYSHLILIQFTFVSDKEELLLLASFAEANRCPESFG